MAGMEETAEESERVKQMNPYLFAGIAALLAASYVGYSKLAAAVKDLPNKAASAAFPQQPSGGTDKPTLPAAPPRPTAPESASSGDTARNVTDALGKILTAAAPTVKTIVDRASSGPKQESNIVNDVAKDFIDIDWEQG